MNDVVLSQQTCFENALMDLSQAASAISDQMIQQNKMKENQDMVSISLDAQQLTMLESLLQSIKQLSDVYANLYGQTVDEQMQQENKDTSRRLHKTVSRSMLKSQESERQRIAADLHDSVVQNLVHLSQQIEIVQRSMDQDMISARLELAEMKKNIKEIIGDIRDTIFNLRPMTFDDIGWDAAFTQLKEMIESHADCSVLLEIDKPEIEEQLYLITIYRIVREACINAMKHSMASNIQVVIKNMENHVDVVIEDNGVGFPVDKEQSDDHMKHFGLDVMRERILLLSGEYDIMTDQGSGTKIEIKIPV